MDILQIVGLGLIASLLTLVIKEQKPLFAFMIASVTGLMIFGFLIGKISDVIVVLQQLADKTGVQLIFLKTILKIIGIAYIAEFGAHIVRDAGQESIAAKIELTGKVLILIMSLPILSVIIDTVLQLLPT